MKSEMKTLFNQVDNIPQIPEVVRILISQANDPRIDFKPIAEMIKKEQVIALKVLRLVNSAHYGLSRKVGSIQQALVILGIDELKKLIVICGLVSSIDEMPGLSLDDFWLDNFRTATYAKWLAEETKLDNSDMIFTAGLISSLGKVLIHLDDATTARKINAEVRSGMNRPDSERNNLGYTHQEVCAELCRIWQFSDDLIDTVSKAGEPLNFDDVSVAACSVYIARYISESSYNEQDTHTILANFPYKAWQTLGFTVDDIAEKMAILLSLDTGLEGLLD